MTLMTLEKKFTGNFSIKCHLGHFNNFFCGFRGQFSVIYRCLDRKTHSIFAAKVIDSSAADSLSEYEIVRSLKHERIAELSRAMRYKNDYMVLIMDKLDGMDILTYLCQRDQYTEEDVSIMMRQTLDALQYLHLLGIAHLNLQPDNLVLETPWKPSVKLIDFGSAKRIPEDGLLIRNITTPLDYRGQFIDY
jgi:serine/threonine protein kinase